MFDPAGIIYVIEFELCLLAGAFVGWYMSRLGVRMYEVR